MHLCAFGVVGAVLLYFSRPQVGIVLFFSFGFGGDFAFFVFAGSSVEVSRDRLYVEDGAPEALK